VLKVEDLVDIYEDAVTETKLEGKAKLIKKTNTPDNPINDRNIWSSGLSSLKETRAKFLEL